MKCLKIENIRNKVFHSDCLKFLKRLPSNSIPLIVTSPPYNMRNTTGGWAKSNNGTEKWSLKEYEGYSDCLPHNEYVNWQRSFISESLRTLSDDGALFYNHKWRVQGGLLQDRSDIVRGFPVRQIIIWHRKGGLNFNRTYFLPTYEVIYLIAKPDFRLRQGFSSLSDVWSISPENNNSHPAPFPLEIPKRCIEATDANLVLDPFSGSGTTALAALSLNRSYICIDSSKTYCKLSKNRIKNRNV